MTVKNMEAKLVLLNVARNHHKFYYMRMDSTNSLQITYGRIGTKIRWSCRMGGVSVYNDILLQKLNKGYVYEFTGTVEQLMRLDEIEKKIKYIRDIEKMCTLTGKNVRYFYTMIQDYVNCFPIPRPWLNKFDTDSIIRNIEVDETKFYRFKYSTKLEKEDENNKELEEMIILVVSNIISQRVSFTPLDVAYQVSASFPFLSFRFLVNVVSNIFQEKNCFADIDKHRTIWNSVPIKVVGTPGIDNTFFYYYGCKSEYAFMEDYTEFFKVDT